MATSKTTHGTTPAGGAAADRTGARTEEAAAAIARERGRIDDLDARIIALIEERARVSAGIQRARLASGGRRDHLARETEILRRYRAELGRPGTQLAMALLELCRGRA